MIVAWALLVALLFGGARYDGGGLAEDYLSKERTTAVNGFFIGWVFLRHVCDYAPGAVQGFLGRAFGSVESLTGQLIVVTFLFFSGYGVMEQIKRKGREYILTFPKKRILKVILEFDVAVLFFVVVGFATGRVFSIGRIVRSFAGWSDVGNSNWYIFIVLLCYGVTYVAYRLDRVANKLIAVLILLSACGLALFYLKPFWWWNTILAYAAGMAYSQYKVAIEARLRERYWLWLLLLLIGHVASRWLSKALGLACPARALFLNLGSVFFALAVVMVMMRVSFGNRAINWMGAHLFPIYIYQRLAMIVVMAICGQALVGQYPYWYMAVCAGLTALIAVAYERVKMFCIRKSSLIKCSRALNAAKRC